jgi:hypothetical protein
MPRGLKQTFATHKKKSDLLVQIQCRKTEEKIDLKFKLIQNPDQSLGTYG